MTLFDLFNIKPEENKTETTENKPVFFLNPEEAQQRFQEITRRLLGRAQNTEQKTERETTK